MLYLCQDGVYRFYYNMVLHYWLYFKWDGRAGLPEWSLGFVDLQRGAALDIGTILMARVRAHVSFKTCLSRLKKLFALFVILVSIYILVN
jgi:uncharacterized membrane protein YfcA